MSSIPTDIVRGALKLDTFIEGRVFRSIDDLLKAIPDLFSVEVPATITNVIVSNNQPGEEFKEGLWVRQDNSGRIVGLYTFHNGNWVRIFPILKGIYRVYGDSRYPPEGFEVALDTNPRLPAGVGTQLMTQWVMDPTSTWYVMFDVISVTG